MQIYRQVGEVRQLFHSGTTIKHFVLQNKFYGGHKTGILKFRWFTDMQCLTWHISFFIHKKKEFSKFSKFVIFCDSSLSADLDTAQNDSALPEIALKIRQSLLNHFEGHRKFKKV